MPMRKRIPDRIPEADATSGAIPDLVALDMDQYSGCAKRYMGAEYRKLIGRLVSQLGVAFQGRVLEIGPGPGWIGIWLAKHMAGVDVVGVELSADMIRVAEKNRAIERVNNVRFVEGDAANLHGFDDQSVDAVVSNGSLHHWVDPVAVLDEIARVAKPSAVLAVQDGRRDLGFGANRVVRAVMTVMWLDPWAPSGMRRGWNSSIAAAYTPGEVREMLGRSRLRNCEVEEGLLDLLIHSTAGRRGSRGIGDAAQPRE
jgi:ubiquinone/menaquinone biosynthesis C-methylase UbiE